MNGEATVLPGLGRKWALNLLVRQAELRHQVRLGTAHAFCGDDGSARIAGHQLPASLASLAALAEAAFLRRLASEGVRSNQGEREGPGRS